MKAMKTARALSARLSIVERSMKSFVYRLATGGDWANAQPLATRRNLVWFWFDGLFASGSDNVVATYLTVFLLALGATQGQIGLMSSLSSLTAAAMLLIGAGLVERSGRKRSVVLVAGGIARTALLLLAVVPFLLSGSALIIVGIALSISRDALANLSYPAWMAITGDIIPIEGRGRYFASRNFIMGITGMAATFLVGLLIPRFTGTGGYQFALGLAFFVGLFAIYSFAHINDRMQPERFPRPPAPALAIVPDVIETSAVESTVPVLLPTETSAAAQQRKPLVTKQSLKENIREFLSYPEFVQFLGVTSLWNIALNFAGPFFTVHMVKNLGANASMVGLTAIASSLSGMLIQFKLGELNDRWGSRKLTVISGLLIPMIPLAWAFIDSVWYVIPINLISGALWGAYGMGSFNYLLQITPQERRARFSAIFQMVVTLSLAVGAALGSLVVAQPWGFFAVFSGSAAGRLAAALLFARLSTRKKVQRIAPVS